MDRWTMAHRTAVPWPAKTHPLRQPPLVDANNLVSTNDVVRLTDMNTEEIWSKYRQFDPQAASYEAWSFCGGGEAGDRLAELVLEGKKTATASAYQLYMVEEAPLPSVGGLSIILRSNGEAACIIETTDVRVCRFCEVTPEHANNEGEGDRSLEYWRTVHQECFSKELEANGLRFDEDMLVVCETFRIVFR